MTHDAGAGDQRVYHSHTVERALTRVKDGIVWNVGTQADVDWITNNTPGRWITRAIPPIFEAYATLAQPGAPGRSRDLGEERKQDLALIELLERHTAKQPWWLGYLDTGASDVVFSDAPKVMVYLPVTWKYVLVQAGPEQAVTWRPARDGKRNWKSSELPDLMFPDDHTWLISTLWDDDWACIGGSEGMIADLLHDPLLGRNARRVTPEEDDTPPGHADR
ncbi:MAG TPA: hypothetical protein VFA16_21170 [Mycobacterium sp.]|uniref:hypothetical protein n=1 Tax=Mycobacterium sp. TaxID=1785 RepID=UPI002D4168C6|nr:hypothetical protein [Mycobacterium sp.]HZU49740.1 hypothetical protein [Mycobacterium sp.]